MAGREIQLEEMMGSTRVQLQAALGGMDVSVCVRVVCLCLK
jgi:hypothetical protein